MNTIIYWSIRVGYYVLKTVGFLCLILLIIAYPLWWCADNLADIANNMARYATKTYRS